MHQQQFAAYVGLDWGDRRHSVHLQVAGDHNTEWFELEQKPEALQEWVARLLKRFQGARHELMEWVSDRFRYRLGVLGRTAMRNG